MKNITLLVVLFLALATFVNADVNLDNLKAAHINAMKYYGRADLLANREGKMFFLAMGKNMASVFLGSEISTGYTESDNKKIYWEVTPIPGGLKIYIKINILGKVFEKTIIIKFDERELTIKDESPSDERVDVWCIIKCAGTAALQCLPCGTNWVCWATCAGPGVVSCIMGCF